MHVEYSQLKDFLLDAGLVSKADFELVEKLTAEKNGRLEDVLVSEGKISEDDLRRVQAHLLGIPFVDLKGIKVDFPILSMIPEPVARHHNIVAYKKTTDGLEVAMLDPQDLESVEFIKKKLAIKIMPRLTDRESMRDVLVQYQKSLQAEFGEIIRTEARKIQGNGGSLKLGSLEAEAMKITEADSGDLKKLAEDLPIVRIVDSLLNHAILQSASDIHIEQFERELLVRYRIDGILHDAMILPSLISAGIVARIKVLSNLRLDEKRLPQDGRFKIIDSNTKQSVAFRVSILPTYYGEKIVMRLLPDAVRGFTLEKLGFHGKQLDELHRSIRKTTGMILVTGPTGSGKTTTLYTMMDILNTPKVNISTIEDPIEYQMPRVNQTQVKPDIGFTFSSGLRTLVRQDPDIIMVGEIRDKETAMLSINAALTGHLVLSTLHTNSAAGAIPRLLDMGVEPFLIVSTLNVVIAQRLVRRLAGEKEKYKPSESEISELGKHMDMALTLKTLKEEQVIKPGDDWSTINLFKAHPSEEHKDGYSGRLGIYETLPVTNSVKELIMKRSTTNDIEGEARRAGMITMPEDGLFKAVRGETTIEEVFRVANEG